jgi:hypothetical protein
LIVTDEPGGLEAKFEPKDDDLRTVALMQDGQATLETRGADDTRCFAGRRTN